MGGKVVSPSQGLLVGEQAATHLQSARAGSLGALGVRDAVLLVCVVALALGAALAHAGLEVEVGLVAGAVDAVSAIVEGLAAWAVGPGRVLLLEVVVEVLPVGAGHAAGDQSGSVGVGQLIVVQLHTLVLVLDEVLSLDVAGRALLVGPVVEAVAARALDALFAVEEGLALRAVHACRWVRWQLRPVDQDGAVVGRWVGAVGGQIDARVVLAVEGLALRASCAVLVLIVEEVLAVDAVGAVEEGLVGATRHVVLACLLDALALAHKNPVLC